MPPRVLVAGIGNICLGDDAFGVEVARRLAAQALPDGARVIDFGIRGLDLAYALLDGYEAVVLIDAAPRGGTPGTLYVLELSVDEAGGAARGALPDVHRLDPFHVLRLAATWGTPTVRLLLVGCEPTPVDDPEDFGMSLSVAVALAVDAAVPLVTSLVARLLRGEDVANGGSGVLTSKEAEPCCD